MKKVSIITLLIILASMVIAPQMALVFAQTELPEIEPSLAERLIVLFANPYVAPLLLMLGIAGIVVEIFTVGWGIAGMIGVISLALYFGSNFLIGATGWGAILLFLLGMILLGIEAFVPGFGVSGIAGVLCMSISIILAAPTLEVGIISLTIAIVGTIVLLLLSFKLLRRRKIWSRLILETKYKKEDGYISQEQGLERYVGQFGTAYTILRPAGIAILGDGTRLDVVSGGDFISKGKKVEIIAVEGMRIVVRQIQE